MADNVTANAGSGGATFRTLEDGSQIQWPVSVVAYATTVGTPDELQIVTSAAPLPVTVSGVATAANQATGNTSLATIAGAVSGTEVQVDIISSALPTGASTAANQSTANTSLASIDSKLTAVNTDAVVVSSSALPTGAATAANQSTIIGHVDGIETLLGTIDTDTGAIATSIASVDGKITACNTGAVVVSSSALPSGAATSARQDTGNTSLASIDSKITAVNTGAVVVSSSALPTGASTAALQGTGNTALAAIQTSVETLDNAISGSEMQVDVVGALPAGDNNIGNVDLASAIPAGTNLLGKVSASPDTDTIYSGTTALTPKFAKISAASSGDNTLVAAVTSKKIRVLSLFMVNSGTAVSVYLTSGAAGTAIFADSTNKIPLDKTGAAGPSGFSLGHNPQGWFETASGAALVINLSAAQGVAGGLSYVEV